MRHFTYKNLLLILLLLTLITYSFTCSTTKDSSSEPSIEIFQSQNPIIGTKPCKTEPEDSIYFNKNLQKAWKQFTANGQYRLACDSDADLSEYAKYPEGYTMDKRGWYMHNYGNWNYPKRDYEAHLAAIVVDTTRTDTNRFSLVVFSPPRTEKNTYEINWLYRDRDLSRATVGMSSGGVWVNDDLTVKKDKICFIRWNRSEKFFQCN